MDRKRLILLFKGYWQLAFGNWKGCRLLAIGFWLLAIGGCNQTASVDDVDLDEIFSTGEDDDEQSDTDAMKVVGVKFSPDFKTFSLYTSVVKDMGTYAFTDSNQTYFKTPEIVGGIENTGKTRPRLVKVINSEADELAKRHFKLNVLVDLSLPQDMVDKERDAVKEMRTVYARHNLYVCFMYGNNVTETMEATDYVLDTYFKTQPDKYKLLYRAIQLKKREMENSAAMWADAVWKGLVIFSDEKVYDDDDAPYDPMHFEMEEFLVREDSLPNDKMSIHCVCFDESGISDVDQASSVLKSLCQKNHGVYQEGFFWQQLKSSLVKAGDSPFIANEFVFENPDGKIYRGNPHHMRIEAYAKESDSLIGVASAAIILGSAYNPVIVNGPPVLWMFVQGISIGLFILLLVWVAFQFIAPYIRHRFFERKYVVKYARGLNMSVGNRLVSEECYYCKAPFEDGDEVVVKCSHSMHRGCWEENGYHCPEFGRHCHEGSHYYNRHNLMDGKNASFYMRWMMLAICAAILAWLGYMIYATNYHLTNEDLVAQMHTARLDVLGTSAVFGNDSDRLKHMPVFGLAMGFFLTLALSALCVRRQELKRRVANTLIRGAITGVASWLYFFVFSTLVFAFGLHRLSILLDWIPWAMMAMTTAFISTVGTRVRLRKSLLAIGIVIGVVSMYLWSYLFQGSLQLDIRSLLMITCILYATGLAAAVAEMSPKSEHYFLNIKGAIKEMDVAVYKWLQNNPDQIVTIGKSIDCSIQMTWDLKGKVAPVHAEIRLINDGLRLKAMEEGVTANGKPLERDKSIWLYHNTEFQIGDTTFTYVERDI